MILKSKLKQLSLFQLIFISGAYKMPESFSELAAGLIGLILFYLFFFVLLSF
jgi:hypothetical protein